MKILIFGAGGVGSLLGGFLSRMGHDVSLLGRSLPMDAIRKKGLKITGIWGDYHIKALEVYDSLETLQAKNIQFDFIFLTVKSFDTQKAVEEILTLMREKTMLVSFQNGLGNIESILEKINADQFLAGRIITGVAAAPGEVKVTVTADAIAIGALPGAKPKVSAVMAAQVLSNAKIPARAVTNILTFIWAKVIYNCALNGICALHEMPYGKILETQETKDWMQAIVKECYAVAEVKGISLDPANADAYNELLIQTLIPRTASHYPSMLQDLRKGKRLEIDAMNGAICRLGLELGIATPANERLVAAIRKKVLS